MKTALTILLFILLLLGGFVLFKELHNSNRILSAQLAAKEMVIAHRENHIALLRDSMRKVDSIATYQTKARLVAESQARQYRIKYEAVRAFRTSQNADTLHVVIGVCDSTVLRQDTLITRLNNENKALVLTKSVCLSLADSLQVQVNDLAATNKLTRQEMMQAMRKAKRQRIWKTARDIGVGVIVGILIL